MGPELKLILFAISAIIALYAVGRAIQGIVYLFGFFLIALLAALPFIFLIISIFLALIYQKPGDGYQSSYIIILGVVASATTFVLLLKSKLLKKIQQRISPPPPPSQSYKIDLSTLPPPPPKKPK